MSLSKTQKKKVKQLTYSLLQQGLIGAMDTGGFGENLEYIQIPDKDYTEAKKYALSLLERVKKHLNIVER